MPGPIKSLPGLMLLVTALSVSEAEEPQARSSFRLIVHPSNPITGLDRRVVANIYLKKQTQWSQGDPIHPVDLDHGASVRQKFAQEVIGRSVAAVKSYWNQLIFSGRDTPPPELKSEQEVIRYVSKHPGGIGYVSPSIELKDVKVIALQ
jgi:ABC-type phosphate transport system substrate-binding protein